MSDKPDAYVLVIPDHKHYDPVAWGPFASEDSAADHVEYLDGFDADAERWEVLPLYSPGDPVEEMPQVVLEGLRAICRGDVEPFSIGELESLGIKGVMSSAGRLDDDAIMEQARELLSAAGKEEA